jgi:hypothetical protein
VNLIDLFTTCIDAGLDFLVRYWASLVLVAAALLLPRFFKHAWTLPAPPRRVAYVIVGALSLATSALTLHFRGQPQPPSWYLDDYGYLLNADTFLHGRLANPPHPMRAHFESMWVLQEPSYIAQYLPGNPLVLAFGRLIAGRAVVGIEIVTILAALAILWALRGWVGEGWAFALACVAVVHPLIAEWSVVVHSGSLAVLGGALVVGAAMRGNGVAFGLGAVLLLFTRPYEGFFVGLIFGVLMIRRLRPTVAAAAIVVVGVGLLMVDNVATTGHALKLPYAVYNERVCSIPFFIWQKARPVPHYDVPEIAVVQTMYRNTYFRWRTPRGLLDTAWSGSLYLLKNAIPVGSLWLAALLPLIALRNRFIAIALLIALFSLLQTSLWPRPHYAAPYAALFAIAYALGIARLPPWLARASFLALAVLVLAATIDAWRTPFPHGTRKAINDAVTRRPGPHLVLVPRDCRYLVYNGADIDRQRVVWARDVGDNNALLHYYAGRTIWRLDAGCARAMLVQPGTAARRDWERDPLLP